MTPRIPFCLLLFAAGARSEIIDRIAVSVGNQVITASDLDREIRVTAFLNGTNPDFTPAGKRRTADRMVEQRLVRRELEMTRYPTPAPSDADPVLKKFQEERYPKPGDYEAALVRYGIADRQVRDEILWQLTFLRFVQVRFRAGIQVGDDEAREYFEKNVKPAAERSHPGQPVSFDEYRDSIEDSLAQQQVDRALDAWLQEAKRVGVEYREEVFQP